MNQRPVNPDRSNALSSLSSLGTGNRPVSVGLCVKGVCVMTKRGVDWW